jgi:hypothetical protein
MDRYIAQINEVYLQSLPALGIYRIYIRVYLQNFRKIVLMQPETGPKEKLIHKYGLLETAFKNMFSGIESRNCIVKWKEEEGGWYFEEYL